MEVEVRSLLAASASYLTPPNHSSCTLTLALPKIQLRVMNTDNNKRKKIRFVRVRGRVYKNMIFPYYNFIFNREPAGRVHFNIHRYSVFCT